MKKQVQANFSRVKLKGSTLTPAVDMHKLVPALVSVGLGHFTAAHSHVHEPLSSPQPLGTGLITVVTKNDSGASQAFLMLPLGWLLPSLCHSCGDAL